LLSRSKLEALKISGGAATGGEGRGEERRGEENISPETRDRAGRRRELAFERGKTARG